MLFNLLINSYMNSCTCIRCSISSHAIMIDTMSICMSACQNYFNMVTTYVVETRKCSNDTEKIKLFPICFLYGQNVVPFSLNPL